MHTFYFSQCVTVLSVVTISIAETWTVDDDGKADFANIQEAIDAAADGDEILVMPGTYTGTGDGGRVAWITGKSVWLHSSDGPESTILDAQAIDITLLCYGKNSTDSIIDGFTITGGNGGSSYSGGVYIADYCSPTISNCIITGNVTTGDGWAGGGLGMQVNCSPTISDCIFENNYAFDGGGMFMRESCNPIITNCTFVNNTAVDDGGGIYVTYDSMPEFSDCIFMNNTSSDKGGGVCVTQASVASFFQCDIDGNSALYGGGIYSNISSQADVSFCSISNNISSDPSYGNGGAIYTSPTSLLTLTDAKFCGNIPEPISGQWVDGGGTCIAVSCQDSDKDGWPDECDPVGDGIHHVPDEYGTIQEAINAAGPNEEIIIAPGTYTGADFAVINLMSKDLWIHSSDGASVTIIDGEGKRIGILSTGGESSDTIIEGFTISGCYSQFGGGAFMFGSFTTFKDCVFENNEVYGSGAGMYNHYSSPALENCIFRNNTAVYGAGAIVLHGSNSILTNCEFEENTASYGGAVWVKYAGSVSLTGCSFTNNVVTGDAGAISIDNENETTTLTDCSFTGNTSVTAGGAMSTWTSIVELTGCTFENNTTGDSGGAIYSDNSTNAIDGCYFSGNSADLGGGIRLYGSALSLSNSTISSNTASSLGGGVLSLNDSTCSLVNSQVCGNLPDQLFGFWDEESGNCIVDSCDDLNNDGTPDECQCLEDVNGDGEVNISDILAMIAAWGCSDCPDEDVNGDGIVNISDILSAISNWGSCE